MKTEFKIIELNVTDIITTSTVIWNDGNVTPPTDED